jgi:hypothetical protein
MDSTVFELLRELEREFEEESPELEWDEIPSRNERFVDDPIGRPIFDIACTGCADGGCHPVLRSAIVEAIRLAIGAARKLEVASSLGPSLRDKDAKETARLFRAFFCHDPSLPIVWAGNQASGLSVAKRLRSVAKELGGGRRILFLCLPTRSDCPRGDPTCCGVPEINARSVPGSNTVGLCEDFWADQRLPGLPDLDRRAGTIVHEMLHLLFAKHGISATRTTPEIPATGILDQGPKRANAHCYKAFVLRVNGFGRDPLAVEGCGPC